MKHEVRQGGVVMLADMKRRAVKIHHPTLRNCVFTITQPKLYPEPFPCPMCGVTHIYKTFHLNLDANGDVTVHEEIYELFKTEGMVEDLNAKREVIPRPQALMMPSMDFIGKVLKPGEGNHERAQPPASQPLIVVSRENGLVKGP